MASVRSDSDEMITAINVTPLVDVVLVLLVIFMITAPMIYQSALKVNLPSAKSAEKVENVTLRFTLQKDGKIAVGNQLVEKDQIPAYIKRALEKDPAANAVISADSSVEHGTVISLIDLVKSNGIAKFALSVKSADPAPANKIAAGKQGA